MNSTMSGGKSRYNRLREATAAALIICLLAVFFSSFLTISAMAGTETGEFCPTCPDWTNLDGWLAKKDAYERAQLNGQQNVQANSNPTVTAKVDPPKKGYPMPELITSAASFKSDRVVLDVRSEPDYRSGHIPGARSLYWKDLQKNGILNPALAKEALDNAGVTESDRLVVYGDSEEGAAFVFWALSYLGHKNVSLLDGGADAARDVGVALTTNAPFPMPSNYTTHIVPWLLVTPDNLESMLGLSDVRILDARDFSEYGRSRMTNGSICLSQDKIYDNSRIKDADKLKDLFGRRLDESGTAIVYGTPQAYSLFYSLKLMGYNATLLEGDWWKETKWAVSNIK
ncbi:MAG TPA: rhodanese-like domain-containing protein [Methanothrix sp.]|nr:rhodanese-like domain-containing protein [Methanothrix sp.]